MTFQTFQASVKYLVVGTVFLFAMGCSKIENAPAPSLSETQKKFEEKCRVDFDLHVRTRQVDNTFFIYLTTDKPLIDYEAQQDLGDKTNAAKPSKFNINYLEGKFDINSFNFEYDIVDKKKSSTDDAGYSMNYTESYLKQQQGIFVAMSESFLDVNPKHTEKLPEFFVIIITDIVKGFESRSVIEMNDFKRYVSGDLPQEEFMKRYLSDAKGGLSMIGDEIGTHIDYTPITMTDFLTKQIVNRIRFKFQRSDFQPGDDYDRDIANQVADTFSYYTFKDYAQVKLLNLRLEHELKLTPEEILKYGEDSKEGPKIPVNEKDGKLIRIIFENGKATFPDEDKKTPTVSNTTEETK